MERTLSRRSAILKVQPAQPQGCPNHPARQQTEPPQRPHIRLFFRQSHSSTGGKRDSQGRRDPCSRIAHTSIHRFCGEENRPFTYPHQFTEMRTCSSPEKNPAIPRAPCTHAESEISNHGGSARLTGVHHDWRPISSKKGDDFVACGPSSQDGGQELRAATANPIGRSHA